MTSKQIVIAHLTDTHFNFLRTKEAWGSFFDKCNKEVESHDVDCFVLTGDISEAEHIMSHLELLEQYLPRPCYFVCGNHDFYNGSIVKVRETIKNVYSNKSNKELIYLTTNEDDKLYQDIKGKLAIVGHDGWYDGLLANWHTSKVMMNDYFIIAELKPLVHNELLDKIRALSQEGADHVYKAATKAIADGYKNILVATHVPPYKENSTYEGKVSDGDWLPHFSSALMGVTLTKLAEENPSVEFLTLCGHSHGEACHKPFKNSSVYTGLARYGEPKISKIHIIDV